MQTEVLDNFLFADDVAKGAPTEKKMHILKTRLAEAVLTSTHNLCFEQKYENYQFFLSEIFQFFGDEIFYIFE